MASSHSSLSELRDIRVPVAAPNSFRVQRAFYLYQPVYCTQRDSETVIWDVLDSRPCPGQVSDQMGLAQGAVPLPFLPLPVQVLQERREMPQATDNSSVRIFFLITQQSLLCFLANLDMLMPNGDWLAMQIPPNGCYSKWLTTLHLAVAHRVTLLIARGSNGVFVCVCMCRGKPLSKIKILIQSSLEIKCCQSSVRKMALCSK